MDLLLQNLLSPPILFFFLGALAVAVGSDLEIPQPLPRLFSLYLLFAIGFHGGVALAGSPFDRGVVTTLAASVGMAIAVPLLAFPLLRVKFGQADAAAVAATYGSISAVTFITAVSFLETVRIAFGGHMVAAMALMESPAVIIGVLLARRGGGAAGGHASGLALVREGITNGSVFLILGSLAIGLVSGQAGHHALAPFTEQIFKGMLAFFLLDMGIVAARRVRALGRAAGVAAGYAVGLPVVNAVLALGVAVALQMARGDAVLFIVLCASASYIAVPAAMRLAVPEANPGLYVSMALGITFPFNIAIGLPLYVTIVNRLWGTP